MTSINTRCNIDSVTNEIKAVDTINNVYGHLCTMCTKCNHGNDIIRKKRWANASIRYMRIRLDILYGITGVDDVIRYLICICFLDQAKKLFFFILKVLLNKMKIGIDGFCVLLASPLSVTAS